MTIFSGALDNSNFDGNTILLECDDSKYIFISGYEIFEFGTSGKFIDYISLMGNIMTPYAFAEASEYSYSISTHYNLIENDRVEEGTLLNSSNDSLDPYDYHLEKSGPDAFKKLLECNRIHSSWPGKECGVMEQIVENDEDVEEDVNIHELVYRWKQ